MRARKLLAGVLFLAASAGLSWADVLKLKDGRELEGLIVQIDDSTVLIRSTDAGSGPEARAYPRAQVYSIRLSRPELPALRKLAERSESSEGLQASVQIWRIVCSLWPESAADQLKLAQSLRRLGLLEESAARADAAAKADPRDARIPLEQGEISLARGDAKQAIACVRDHFRLRSGDTAEGNWLLGRASEKSFLVEEALSAYRMVLLADPGRKEVLERFVRFALAHGKNDSATEMARCVISLAPSLRSGWLALGRVEYRRGRWNEAVSAFQSATSLGGDDYERARIFLHCARARQAHRDPRAGLRSNDLAVAGELDGRYQEE